MREDRLAALGRHELAELDALVLGLVGHEDVDGVGFRVVELDLDGVRRLAAVRIGERHVRRDAGCADPAEVRRLAELATDAAGETLGVLTPEDLHKVTATNCAELYKFPLNA